MVERGGGGRARCSPRALLRPHDTRNKTRPTAAAHTKRRRLHYAHDTRRGRGQTAAPGRRTPTPALPTPRAPFFIHPPPECNLTPDTSQQRAAVAGRRACGGAAAARVQRAPEGERGGAAAGRRSRSQSAPARGRPPPAALPSLRPSWIYWTPPPWRPCGATACSTRRAAPPSPPPCAQPSACASPSSPWTPTSRLKPGRARRATWRRLRRRTTSRPRPLAAAAAAARPARAMARRAPKRTGRGRAESG